MKKNRITIIIVVILLIIAAALILNNSRSTLKQKESDFAVRDTSKITKIFIADKNNNQVNLEKVSAGNWLINDKHKAHDVKVESLLKTILDIRVRMPVPVKGRDNVIKRMATIGKKVEIYQISPRINIFGILKLFYAERRIRTYYIGDVTQDNQGTYMLMEGSDNPYIVFLPGLRGFVASRYSPFTYEWRDHTVFKSKLRDIAAVSVDYPWEPHKSLKVIANNDNTFSLINPSTGNEVPGYDTARMLGFTTSFMDIRFESLLEHLLEPAFIDSVLSTKPSSIITLVDKSGDTSKVTTYYKEGFSDLYDKDGLALEPFDLDRAYALVNDDEDFVLIQYFVFDKVTRTMQYLTRQEE